MASKLICLKESDNLHQARMQLKKYNIRHLPVINAETGNYIGLVSQKGLLGHAFNIVEKYGLNKLTQREERTPVTDVMNTEHAVISPDILLEEAARQFIDKKFSCLPVVENDRLVGVLTPQDFVKLTLELLEMSSPA